MSEKNNLAISLLLAIILLFAHVSHAQNLNTLLPDLLETHDLINAYQARKTMATHLLRQKKADYYPALNLDTDAGYQAMQREFADDTDMWRAYFNLRATQLITDFGLTSGEIGKAQVVLDRSEHGLETIKQQVLIEGITAYINIVRSRERLKYAWESENNIKKQTKMENALLRKGAGLKSDVLQAKAYLARAQALRVRAQGAAVNARSRFHSVFKKSLTEADALTFELPVLTPGRLPASLEEAVERALENNPRIQTEKLDAEVAQQELHIRKAVNYPRLQLFAASTLREDDDGTRGYKNDLSAGAELKFNLYRGGGDRAAIRAAAANLAASESDIADTRRLIKEEVHIAWQNLITLGETVRVRDNQSAIVAAFLELARQERKIGTRSLLDVLNGEVTYINALSDAIAARADERIAALNLLYTIGELKEDMF